MVRDTQQVEAQIGATKCGKGSMCPWQPRPQEDYVVIQVAESHMGLTDTKGGYTTSGGTDWRHRLAQPNVERAVCAHGNLVLRKAIGRFR